MLTPFGTAVSTGEIASGWVDVSACPKYNWASQITTTIARMDRTLVAALSRNSPKPSCSNP